MGRLSCKGIAKVRRNDEKVLGQEKSENEKGKVIRVVLKGSFMKKKKFKPQNCGK